MTLLPPGVLAALRPIAESGMSGTATIQRLSDVETPFGSEKQWTDSGTTKYWIHEVTPAGTVLGPVGEVEAIAELFQVLVPWGTQAFSGDRLQIGDAIYLIEHTNDDDSYPIYLVLTCRKRT